MSAQLRSRQRQELELRFAWRSHQEDVAGGLEPHTWGQDEASAQLLREGGAWSDKFGHGVSVYLDENLVGVAQGGHFNLSGLVPGIHTLQIVARDAAGNDQEVFPCASWPVLAGARGMRWEGDGVGLTAGGFRLLGIPLWQDPYISDTSVFRVSDIDLASMDLPGSLPVSADCSVLEAP